MPPPFCAEKIFYRDMASETMDRLELVNKEGKGELEEAVQAVVTPTALNKMNEQLKVVDNTKLEHVGITEEHGLIIQKDLSAGFDERTMKEAHTNLAGVIFMCNKRTMKECFYHSLFGLPYNMWHLVRRVVPGTILFLFEYEARKMWGIYEANSYGKLNIERSPYSKGSFPAQVRFKEVERCSPLDEDEFKDAIRENYFSDFKFQFELSNDQVYRLCKAFLWKSASQNKSSLSDHKASEVEDYVPVDYSPSSYEGQQQASVPADHSTSTSGGQQPQYTVYDDSFSNRWLQSDAHDRHSGTHGMPYLERGFPDRFSTSSYTNGIHENHWNRNELISKQAMHASSDREFNFPKISDKGLSIDEIRSRSSVGMLQTCQYNPSVSTQLMHEKLTDIEARGMCRAGLEQDEYAEEFSGLHADRLNHKPSVWSRISTRVTDEEVRENRLGTPNYAYVSSDEITEKEVVVPNYGDVITNRGSGLPDYLTQISAEDGGTVIFQACEEDDLGGIGKTDCIVEDLVEVVFPISFKRRKHAGEGNPQETGKSQGNKRRKITRPVFSDASESMEEWQKEFGQFKYMKPGTDEQLDLVKFKEVEGEQCAKILTTSNSRVEEFQEAFQSSIRNEPSLCSTLFEGMGNDIVKSGNVCKLQDSHVEINHKLDDQLAFDCCGAGPVIDNNDPFHLEREISAQKEASLVKSASLCEVHALQEAPMVDVFCKTTADNRKNGGVLGSQRRENVPAELVSADSAKVIHKFDILEVADSSIVRAEDWTGKMAVDQSEIDLNQPICQSGSEPVEKDLVHCFSEGSSTCAYVERSHSSRGHACQTGGLEPCLYLELTMVPGAPAANLSGTGKGGSSSNKDLVSAIITTEEQTDLELTLVPGGTLSANVDEVAMRECLGEQGLVPREHVLD